MQFMNNIHAPNEKLGKNKGKKINAIHPSTRDNSLHPNERADFPKANKGFTPLTKSALRD